MEPETVKDSALLLRLPVALRESLQRAAFTNSRSLTAEINLRLRASLAPQTVTPHTTGHTISNTIAPAWSKKNLAGVSDTDQAMLTIFRALPPEKQLALLSLFK